MRLDVVTIFPDYLQPLDLSLVGKAREAGTLRLAVHDLRDWATDRHRSVDDTPFGGGAGMVMRADVWGATLDDVLGEENGNDDPVLIIPSPAGEAFTQSMAAELAAEQRIIIACGRYEGIDARVAEHYARRGVRVREISIGDYVLNGGEVAALVITEAVARLLPGVVGNPDSLVEESHGGDGLLEYPSYTKPPQWRGLNVPDVLLSGHHGRVAAWRREQALGRTAERRPDLVRQRDATTLSKDDRRTLARLGWFARPDSPRLRELRLRDATPGDAAALADLAAITFPLACPPDLAPSAVSAHIDTHLSPAAMGTYLTDPTRLLVVAEPAEAAAGTTPEPVGYAMLIGIDGDDVILDKCYVHPDYIGSGLADAVLSYAVERATDLGVRRMTLGTNVGNRRAQRFYRRHGFVKAGHRDFHVGGTRQRDVVMALELPPPTEQQGRAVQGDAIDDPAVSPPGAGVAN